MNINSPPVWVVAAVLRQDDKVLIVRRGPLQSGAGFWEFPGGKVEPEESPEEALAREIHEELGLRIRVGEFITEVIHAYPAKTIRLHVFWADPLSAGLVLTEHDAFEWIRPQDIQAQRLSEADRPVLPLLISQMKV